MRSVDITDFDRGILYGLRYHAGWSNKRISSVTKIPYSTVKKFCYRNEINASLNIHQKSQRKACGRKRITSPHFDKRIRSYSLKNRKLSANAIAINFRNEQLVSHDTVNRRLNEKGIKARKPCNKPLLSDLHKRNRLRWAMENEDLNWGSIAFSDEKTFLITGYTTQFVRRRTNERYKEVCVNSVANRSKGSCNVWACFAKDGYSKLKRIEGRLNSEKYTQMLTEELLHFMNQNPQVTHFQQDNCPIHISQFTKRWFQNNNLNLLGWPALSADANPIENVWAELDKRLKMEVLQPTNSNELFKCVNRHWILLMDDPN